MLTVVFPVNPAFVALSVIVRVPGPVKLKNVGHFLTIWSAGLLLVQVKAEHGMLTVRSFGSSNLATAFGPAAYACWLSPYWLTRPLV